MKTIELNVHARDGVDPKPANLGEESTVNDLLKVIFAEGVVIHELEEEVLFLVDEEEKLLNRLHKLGACGFKHGHHVRLKSIEVAVVTTSGSWPEEGFERVPIQQPVKVDLQRAAKKLRIADTTNWVAKVGGKEIDIEKSYHKNGLNCKVEIDFGPREGGGGCE